MLILNEKRRNSFCYDNRLGSYDLGQILDHTSVNPYTTATNNIGQKYNGPEYQYQNIGRD